MNPLHKSIIITGSGPVGLTIAIMLAKSGLDVCLIDAGIKIDSRILALSYSSFNILEHIGAWDKNSATPIDIVNISHDGFGTTNINATDVKLAHLGFTVAYQDLVQQLYKIARDYSNIQIVSGKVHEINSNKNYATVSVDYNNQNNQMTCDLAIVTDGGKIQIPNIDYHIVDYNQEAIVAHVKLNHVDKKNIAYERLATKSPSVLLPYKNNHVIVWAVNKEKIENTNIIDFLTANLNKQFANRLGDTTVIGKVSSYPLKLQVAKKRYCDRIVLLGNSAQIVHPISAQGLNLGLRDAQALNKTLMTNNNLREAINLSTYDKLRKQDSGFVTSFTNNLINLLEYDTKFVKLMRSAGIIALSNLPKAQNAIANTLIFGF